VWIARLLNDGAVAVVGYGIDTETALWVTPGSPAEVVGEGSVAVLSVTAANAVELVADAPPAVTGLRTSFVTEGFSVDLSTGAVVAVPTTAVAGSTVPVQPVVSPTVIAGGDDSDRMKARWFVHDLSDPNALWHGNLTLANGTPGIANGIVMTNLEASSSEREIRAGGPLWGLFENPTQGIALFLDGYAGDSCNAVQVTADGRLEALAGRGCPDEQSAVVVDCCGLEWRDRSVWDPDGNGLVRQSVALTPCTTTLFNSQVGEAVYEPGCPPAMIFGDGFESGGLEAW
jgi:hypothetical protein